MGSLDGDEIVSAHLAEHQKVRNIRNDPRVALSIEAEGKTNGFDNYLVVYGRARITDGVRPNCCSGWRGRTSDQG